MRDLWPMPCNNRARIVMQTAVAQQGKTADQGARRSDPNAALSCTRSRRVVRSSVA